MRIIDSIPHPVWKVSIFHLNDKYAVKLENGPYEQIYKFKDSTPLEAVKQTFTPDFVQKAESIFKLMHENKMTAFNASRDQAQLGQDQII